ENVPLPGRDRRRVELFAGGFASDSARAEAGDFSARAPVIGPTRPDGLFSIADSLLRTSCRVCACRVPAVRRNRGDAPKPAPLPNHASTFISRAARIPVL